VIKPCTCRYTHTLGLRFLIFCSCVYLNSGFLRIDSVFGHRQIRSPAVGLLVSAELAWRSGISDPTIASSEKSLQVTRKFVTTVLTLPTHVLRPHRIVYGFSIMIHKQFISVFQLIAPEVKYFTQINTWNFNLICLLVSRHEVHSTNTHTLQNAGW